MKINYQTIKKFFHFRRKGKFLQLIDIRFFGIMLLTVSCISSFDPAGLQERAGLLVVEGMILEEGTTIQLSRTVKMNDALAFADYVNNASIHIIDEGHNIIAVAEQQIVNGSYIPGRYIVNDSISFMPGMKYALEMQIDGKLYRSAFLSPVHTPEIDEVTWQINDDNNIDIFVSTHDPDNLTNYFRWDFDENWEIRSPLFWESRYDPTTRTLIPQSIAGDNRYYCWASDHSKSLLIASTARYAETVIKNHKIHSFESGTSRYSYLYSISVKQYGLDNEAYLYFENLQRNLDESGSIFAPQPSEKAGNIQCLSDPEETVIGYVFATKATTYRLYIPMVQLNLTGLEDQYTCIYEQSDPPDIETAYTWGLGLYGEGYASLTCLDCTRRGGAKNKPDFWPNDHQ